MYVNVKMRPVETISGKWGWIKKNFGGGKLKYDICYIVRTLVNATMYPYPAKLSKNKK
jgi:hypothetical protein